MGNAAGSQQNPIYCMLAGALNVSFDAGVTWNPVTASTPTGAAILTALLAVTPFPAQGTALTDAPATINPGTDSASQYTLPLAVPLTANRVLTLGTTGSPVTDSIVTIWKLGAGAFTYTVKDDAATVLFTFASGSTKQAANFYFNGTHWVFLSLVYTA